MKQGGSWDMRQHDPMPRPKNDDGYFEEMSKVVFRAGLNWSVIEKKWPDIKRALANFTIDAVAQFDDSDIDRLLKDEGMIRSVKKITGVIANAQAMQKVQQEFGSFPKYLQAVKAMGEEALLLELPYLESYAHLLMLNISSTVEYVSICFVSSGAFSASPDPFHESAKLILLAKSKTVLSSS